MSYTDPEMGVGVSTHRSHYLRIPSLQHTTAAADHRPARHPVGRLGEVDDVVDAVLYLENAGFVTGEILHVDGGQSAGH